MRQEVRFTDEDSADEDGGVTINNLPGNQLRAGAHARIFSNGAENYGDCW